MAGPTRGFASLCTMDTPKMQNWVCLSPFQFDRLRQQLSRGEITPPGSRKDSEPSSSQTAETRSTSPLGMTVKAQPSFRVQKHLGSQEQGACDRVLNLQASFPGDRRAWMPYTSFQHGGTATWTRVPRLPARVVGPQPPSLQIGSLGGKSFQITRNSSKITPSKDIL